MNKSLVRLPLKPNFLLISDGYLKTRLWPGTPNSSLVLHATSKLDLTLSVWNVLTHTNNH